MQRDQAHRTNELLERIAVALEKNTTNVVYNGELKNTKDIPGFEGTLDALDVLCDIKTITDDYSSKHDVDERDEDDIELQTDYVFNLIKNMTTEQYVKFYHEMDFGFALSDTEAFTEHIVNDLEYDEVLDVITSARNILDAIQLNTAEEAHKYEYDLQGIRVDSDHDIRSTAQYYREQIGKFKDIKTKKDAILDYVTNEFGITGARYTDIIKFAYYLSGNGNYNGPKYDNANRGYYSQAFSTRTNGHLIQGGKDCLVKGINKEDKERYFALSSVDSFTEYYKSIR